MKLLLAAALLACSGAAIGATVTFDLCPRGAALRVERQDDTLLVYCGAELKPRLEITRCPKPATVTTAADGDKAVTCQQGWGTIVLKRS